MTAREVNRDFNFKSIESAGDALQDRLRQDESLGKDLYEQFTYRSDIPGCHRYFVEPYRSSLGSMIERGDSIPLPSAITNHFQRVECASFMGLLPEINRAWITIDNTLYLWNYFQPEEYDVYDSTTEAIVSVALSTPKAGIFQESVQCVLVLATPTNVTVLALCNTGTAQLPSLKLVPTAYSLSSDNVTMVKIVGSQVGRIFMAGSDSNIYELDYAYSENPWASIVGGVPQHKCRKINHNAWNWKLVHLLPPFLRSLSEIEDNLVEVAVDNVRNIFYAITARGCLSAFYLGAKGNETHLFSSGFNVLEESKKFLSSYRSSQESSPRAESFRDVSLPAFQVIGMFVVPYTESKKTQVVVTLASGVRVYLSVQAGYHSPFTKLPTGQNDQAPNSIEIAHIRAPPSLSAIASVQTSKEDVGVGAGAGEVESGSLPNFTPSQCLHANSSYYSHGLYLLGVEKPQQADELVVIYEDQGVRTGTSAGGASSSAATYTPCLKEAISMGLDGKAQTGKIYDIKESVAMSSNVSHQMLMGLLAQSQTPASNSLVRDQSPLQPPRPSLSATYGRDQHGWSGVLNGVFDQRPIEVASTGKYITIAHGTDMLSSNVYGYDLPNSDRIITLNEAFEQHMPSSCYTQRQVLVLTNQGIHVLKKVRVADMVYRHLTTLSSQSEDLVRKTFAFFGLLPSCTITLGIACGLPRDAGSPPLLDVRNSSLPAPLALDPLPLRAMSAVLSLSTHASYKTLNNNPTPQALHDARVVVSGLQHEFFKSTTHDSLYLFVSRILRPLWLRPLAQVSSRGSVELLDCWRPEYVAEVSRPLTRVLEVMRMFFAAAIMGNYTNLGAGAAGVGETGVSTTSNALVTNVMAQRAAQQPSPMDRLLAHQAKQLEDSSLQALYLLVARAVHALDLLDILRISSEKCGLSVSLVELNNISFRSLVISPKIHCAVKGLIQGLVQGLAQQQGGGVEGTGLGDTLVDRLTKQCYHFFSPTDRYLYEGIRLHEQILKTRVLTDRRKDGADPSFSASIAKCIENFLHAAEHINSVEEVVGEESEVKVMVRSLGSLGGRGGLVGCVDLVFKVVGNFTRLAQQMEGVGGGLVGVGSGVSAAGDATISSTFDAQYFHQVTSLSRQDVSSVISMLFTILIDQILHLLHQLGRGGDVSADDIRVMIQHSMDTCSDTCYHQQLYSRLISSEYKELVIQLTSPLYLEPYLLQHSPPLLYAYLSHHQCHSQAVRCMSRIGAGNEQEIPLDERLAYLNNAMTSLMVLLGGYGNGVTGKVNGAGRFGGVGSGVGGGEGEVDYATLQTSMQELKDAIDIATYQSQALTRLQHIHAQLRGSNGVDATYLATLQQHIHSLTYSLLPVNTLFHEVCMVYGLYDIGVVLMVVCHIHDADVMHRLVKAFVYSHIPERSRTERGERFLSRKREETPTQNPVIATNALFENLDSWLPTLTLEVQKLLRTLQQLPPTPHAPLSVLVSELEEVVYVLKTCESSSSSNSMANTNAAVLERGLGVRVGLGGGVTLHILVEVYMDLLERLVGGEGGARGEARGEGGFVAHLLGVFSLVLKRWAEEAVRLEASQAVQASAYLEVIRSGVARGWVDKAKRILTSLLQKPDGNALAGLSALTGELQETMQLMNSVVLVNPRKY